MEDRIFTGSAEVTKKWGSFVIANCNCSLKFAPFCGHQYYLLLQNWEAAWRRKVVFLTPPMDLPTATNATMPPQMCLQHQK